MERAIFHLIVDCRVLEQQIADLSRQVTTLLGQVHRLQGGSISNGARQEQALVPTGANGQATLHDVMTQKLLTFHDIEVSMSIHLRGNDGMTATEMSCMLCNHHHNAMSLG